MAAEHPGTGDGSGGELPAGDVAAWLVALRGAMRGERDAEVPCGTCTACCTSAQFVHIGPDETDTLAHVPAALRFPAPGLPAGHVLLGYDERGHCPMLVDGACSIYEHRPRTCRTYDCRVFPAAGLDGEPAEKPAIAAQARRWRFTHPTAEDAARHHAVAAAAAFLRAHRTDLAPGLVPSGPTQLAALAVAVHELFLVPDGQERPEAADPGLADLEAAIRTADDAAAR